MAGASLSFRPPSPSLSPLRAVARFSGVRCSRRKFSPVDVNNSSGGDADTPPLIKIAVSGVTEVLRILSPLSKRSSALGTAEPVDEVSVSGTDDVVSILKSDYEQAYFVTGRDLYKRNLKLLVPFFDKASIELKSIEKCEDAQQEFILATWKLRTYLKLPWRPLVSIDGRTIYELDNNFEIVRHAESWNVSALQAIGQLFTPNFGDSNND